MSRPRFTFYPAAYMPMGKGALSIGAVTLGAGVTLLGTLAMGPVALTGAGTVVTRAAGNLVVGGLTASGMGTTNVAGSGAFMMGSVTTAGGGQAGVTGAGQLAVGPATAAGAGTSNLAATGTLATGSVTTSGSGSGGISAAGTLATGAITASGSGRAVTQGQGTLNMGGMTMNGPSSMMMVASSRPRLAILSGSGGNRYGGFHFGWIVPWDLRAGDTIGAFFPAFLAANSGGTETDNGSDILVTHFGYRFNGAYTVNAVTVNATVAASGAVATVTVASAIPAGTILQLVYQTDIGTSGSLQGTEYTEPTTLRDRIAGSTTPFSIATLTSETFGASTNDRTTFFQPLAVLCTGRLSAATNPVNLLIADSRFHALQSIASKIVDQDYLVDPLSRALAVRTKGRGTVMNMSLLGSQQGTVFDASAGFYRRRLQMFDLIDAANSQPSGTGSFFDRITNGQGVNKWGGTPEYGAMCNRIAAKFPTKKMTGMYIWPFNAPTSSPDFYADTDKANQQIGSGTPNPANNTINQLIATKPNPIDKVSTAAANTARDADFSVPITGFTGTLAALVDNTTGLIFTLNETPPAAIVGAAIIFEPGNTTVSTTTGFEGTGVVAATGTGINRIFRVRSISGNTVTMNGPFGVQKSHAVGSTVKFTLELDYVHAEYAQSTRMKAGLAADVEAGLFDV